MRVDLAAMTRRVRKTRRKSITLRPVTVPATLATDLYQSCYRSVVAEWERAIPGLVAAYERAFAQMTQDSPADVSQVITEADNGVATLLLTVRARIERWAARLEVLHRQRWRGAVLTATGVDLATMIGPEGARMTIAASVERNTSLIRSVSDETRRRIGEAVFGGFNRRDEPRVVAKAIREAVGMERKRALRIAADQNVKLASQLNIERAQEAGLTHYQWVHSGKLHPRQSHLERNGKRYEYGKPEGDQPGYAIHCGCVSRACLSLDGEF